MPASLGGVQCSDVEGSNLEGAQWIVEARDTGRDHWVDRFSPESGLIRATGMQLMALSRQKFIPVY